MIVYREPNNKIRKHEQVKETMSYHHLPYPIRPVTWVLALTSYSNSDG